MGIFALGLIATPTLKRIKEARREIGRTSSCLSNVQQIAAAFQMYAQDYDDRLPQSSSWMDGAGPYIDRSGANKEATVYQCPTVLVAEPGGFGYAFNRKVAGKALSKLPGPALTQLVYDSTNLKRNASDPVASLPAPGRHRTGGMRRVTLLVNIMGYADGHAKAVDAHGRGLPGVHLDTSQPGE